MYIKPIKTMFKMKSHLIENALVLSMIIVSNDIVKFIENIVF